MIITKILLLRLLFSLKLHDTILITIQRAEYHTWAPSTFSHRQHYLLISSESDHFQLVICVTWVTWDLLISQNKCKWDNKKGIWFIWTPCKVRLLSSLLIQTPLHTTYKHLSHYPNRIQISTVQYPLLTTRFQYFRHFCRTMKEFDGWLECALWNKPKGMRIIL